MLDIHFFIDSSFIIPFCLLVLSVSLKGIYFSRNGINDCALFMVATLEGLCWGISVGSFTGSELIFFIC